MPAGAPRSRRPGPGAADGLGDTRAPRWSAEAGAELWPSCADASRPSGAPRRRRAGAPRRRRAGAAEAEGSGFEALRPGDGLRRRLGDTRAVRRAAYGRRLEALRGPRRRRGSDTRAVRRSGRSGALRRPTGGPDARAILARCGGAAPRRPAQPRPQLSGRRAEAEGSGLEALRLGDTRAPRRAPTAGPRGAPRAQPERREPGLRRSCGGRASRPCADGVAIPARCADRAVAGRSGGLRAAPTAGPRRSCGGRRLGADGLEVGDGRTAAEATARPCATACADGPQRGGRSSADGLRAKPRGRRGRAFGGAAAEASRRSAGHSAGGEARSSGAPQPKPQRGRRRRPRGPARRPAPTAGRSYGGAAGGPRGAPRAATAKAERCPGGAPIGPQPGAQAAYGRSPRAHREGDGRRGGAVARSASRSSGRATACADGWAILALRDGRRRPGPGGPSGGAAGGAAGGPRGPARAAAAKAERYPGGAPIGP